MLTTDPTHPDLGHGVDASPVPQNKAYLVLSEEERAKGFVRPVRTTYRHVGRAEPDNPLRDLTDEEKEKYAGMGWVKYEKYPEGYAGAALGRFWTQSDLDRIGGGCGATTTMARGLAETYARQPGFYGATYCTTCQMHLPVKDFVWEPDGSRVGS